MVMSGNKPLLFITNHFSPPPQNQTLPDLSILLLAANVLEAGNNGVAHSKFVEAERTLTASFPLAKTLP